uniref:Mitotic checkpoint protein BUB3 n=1 Tax=Kalanchoe fedtschenkoi TaxID=63787 RepID=A0A7N0TC37_KALFE
MKAPCLKFENPIQDAISRIRFAPTSNNLLISSWDSNLRLYDVDKAVLRLQVPVEAALLDCCFEDEAVCLTSACDGFVTRYDVQDETKQLLGKHEDLATCVECSIATRQIFSAGWDKKILSWDPRISGAIRPPTYVDAEVRSMSVSSTNLMIAVGKSVLIYDLRYFNHPVQAKKSCMDFHIRCLRSFSDSKGFAAGSIDGRVALDTVQSSELLDKGYAFHCNPKSKDGKKYLCAVNDIAFNPGAFGTFVTGSNDGHVIGWNAQSKKRQFEMPRYANSVAGVSYNFNGQLLAVASSHAYHEAKEIEEEPKIFVHAMDEGFIASMSAGSSARK